MAIIGMQRRIREVGRIRIGVQGTSGTGKRIPRKIDRFRFTSADRRVVEAAAGCYGGKAAAWDNGGVEQWEVITEAQEMAIALPPNPADLGWSQFYEAWAKGFCTRRCDGERDSVRDCLCDCDPENRDCKITSRLSVIVPEIAGLGVWRLESHGYNAGVELAGSLELIEAVAGMRTIVPARLRLEARETRRLVDGEAKVFKFVVPVIDLDVSVTEVRGIGAGGAAVGTGAAATIGPVAVRGGFTPVAELAPPAALSIEEQLAQVDAPAAKPPRKNAAAPLKPSGRKPRTAAERNAVDEDAGDEGPEGCDICGQPYHRGALVRNPVAGGSKYVHKACIEAMETPADPGVEDGADQRDESVPADEPDKSAASQEQRDGGRGGMDGESAEPPATEPTPAAARSSRPARPARPMSHGQHKKVMAMAAQLWPVDASKVTGAEAEVMRRDITLAICAQLGSPGLTSRAEIDLDTAKVLLDALDGIERGFLVWVPESADGPGVLVDTAGMPVTDLGEEPF